jgi:hypothetical protein
VDPAGGAPARGGPAPADELIVGQGHRGRVLLVLAQPGGVRTDVVVALAVHAAAHLPGGVAQTGVVGPALSARKRCHWSG